MNPFRSLLLVPRHERVQVAGCRSQEGGDVQRRCSSQWQHPMAPQYLAGNNVPCSNAGPSIAQLAARLPTPCRLAAHAPLHRCTAVQLPNALAPAAAAVSQRSGRTARCPRQPAGEFRKAEGEHAGAHVTFMHACIHFLASASFTAALTPCHLGGRQWEALMPQIHASCHHHLYAGVPPLRHAAVGIQILAPWLLLNIPWPSSA